MFDPVRSRKAACSASHLRLSARRPSNASHFSSSSTRTNSFAVCGAMLPGPQMLAGALTFQEQACLRAVRDRVALVPAGKLDSERHSSGGLVGSVGRRHFDAGDADVGLPGGSAHLRCQLSLHEPHWPFERFPRVVATCHVTCVKTSLSQRYCTPAPNMKAIDAEASPPSASARAMNSARQRSTEPKSRAIAPEISSVGARPSPPRLAK